MSGQHPGAGSGPAPEPAPSETAAAAAPAPVTTPLAAGQYDTRLPDSGQYDAGQYDAGHTTQGSTTPGSRPPAGARPRFRRCRHRLRPGACPGRSLRRRRPPRAGARREPPPRRARRQSPGPSRGGSPSPGPQLSWQSAPGWGSTPLPQVRRQPTVLPARPPVGRRAARPAARASPPACQVLRRADSPEAACRGRAVPATSLPVGWAAGFPRQCMPNT